MKQFQKTPRVVNRRGFISTVLFVVVFLIGSIGQAQIADFDVRATSAILMDAKTGQVLFEKNADESLEPASLVKIMTMLVAMEAVKSGQVTLADPVRTSRTAAAMGGSQVYLAEGETHSLEQMLKAIAISSANDASVAVAEFFAGTEAAFTNLMNDMAETLGMTNSYFANADGLPVASGELPSVTSARDIATAAMKLVNEHPTVLKWTSTVMETFRDQPEFILYNTNKLIGKFDGLDGLKTGHTQAAGWCLVATAERGNMRLISVVMNTESETARVEETEKLLSLGYTRFVPQIIDDSGVVGTVNIREASKENVSVVVKEPVQILVPRGQTVSIGRDVVLESDFEFPIDLDEEIGEYVISINGNEVLRVPLFTEENVGRANFVVRGWRALRDGIVGVFKRS